MKDSLTDIVKDSLTDIIIIGVTLITLLYYTYSAHLMDERFQDAITASEKRIVKQIQHEFEDAELICPDKTMLPYEMHGLEKQKCKHRRFNPWKECE